MKVIYVSGQYRSRWGLIGKLINIFKARRVAIQLWREGSVVICPHANTALFPEDGIDYIKGDCEIVKRSDAIFMMRGWQGSIGARQELAVAISKGLTIYYD